MLEGGKHISTIFRKGWAGFEELFLERGRGVKGVMGMMGMGKWVMGMGKGWSILGRDSRFLEIAILNSTSKLLFDLLFTCRLKDVVNYLLLFTFILFY